MNVLNKISVAMITYNGQKYVDDQLSSIINQSRRIDEIVIVDDCSTDTTWAILQSYKINYPDIVRCYRNEKSLGPHKNYVKAIGLCTCQFICLSDQDDIWYINKVDSLMKLLLINKDKAIAYSNEIILYENLEKSSRIVNVGTLRNILFNNSLSAHLVLFDSEKVDYRIFEKDVPVDEALAIYGVCRDIIVKDVNELMIWRRHINACTFSSHSITPIHKVKSINKYVKLFFVVVMLILSKRSETIKYAFDNKSKLFSAIACNRNELVFSQICSLISKQTLSAFLKASLSLTKIEFERIKKENISLLQKIKSCLFVFTIPFVFWFDTYKLKAL